MSRNVSRVRKLASRVKSEPGLVTWARQCMTKARTLLEGLVCAEGCTCDAHAIMAQLPTAPEAHHRSDTVLVPHVQATVNAVERLRSILEAFNLFGCGVAKPCMVASLEGIKRLYVGQKEILCVDVAT